MFRCYIMMCVIVLLFVLESLLGIGVSSGEFLDTTRNFGENVRRGRFLSARDVFVLRLLCCLVSF